MVMSRIYQDCQKSCLYQQDKGTAQKKKYLSLVTLTTELRLLASFSVQKKYIIKIMPGNKILFFAK